MPWKESSAMDQKVEFILLWQSGSYTITDLAELFGVSRPTAYKFIERYRNLGMSGLLERSRAPRVVANKTLSALEAEIVELRRQHPRWGGPKLLVLLEHLHRGEELPKPSTISVILKRNDLVVPRKRRRRVEPEHPIFDPKKPNEIWSADFKGKFG